MSFKKISLLLLFSLVTISFTYSQSLEQQARALGISQAQIDSYMKGGNSTLSNATNNNTSTPRTRDEDPNTIETSSVAINENQPNTPIIPIADKKDSRFGETIFSGINSSDLTFQPSLNIATPSDYRLAGGDEVNIDIWGATEQNYTLTVTPEGTILVPGIGPISIGSLTISQAKERVANALSSIYSGLEDDNIKTDLTLGKIRSIKVNVVGEAKKPGTYTLPSLATLFNALYFAGGSNEIGSLRDIKLYRAGELKASFDAYDFIMNGNSKSNIRLEDNDVIVIEPYKNIVSVKGEVKREMRYELKDDETINDLLTYSGGFKGGAYSDKITINRKHGDKYSINSVNKSNFGSFTLLDGDLIEIGSTIEKFDNRLEVKGAVWREGFFEISPSCNTVTKLIKAAGGIKGDAYDIAQITRLLPDYSYQIISVNLGDILAGKAQDIELKSDDRLFVPSLYELKEKSFITVMGEVNNAKIEKDEADRTKKVDEMISEIEFNNMQSQLNATTAQAQIPTTQNSKTSQQTNSTKSQLPKNLDSLLLKRLEYEQLNEKKQFFNNTDNRPEIERKNENIFDYEKGMTLLDAIIAAGGLKESAAGSNIVVSRRIKSSKETQTLDRAIAEVFTFKISDNLNIEDKGLVFELDPYDIVNVRKSPNYYEQQVISINGEVMYPGNYILTSRSERLSAIIARAGNFTIDAYINGTRLVRKKTEDEIAREKSKIALMNIENRKKIAETKMVDGKMVETNEITDEMINIESTYSIGIDIQKALDNPNSNYDPVLRDGDVIVIPQLTNTVKISGGVLYPNTVNFADAKKFKHYLNNAGGYVRRAKKRPYIIYMNGTVALLKASTKIEPGCEIVIPMKQEKVSQPMTPQSWMSMATSAASLAAVTTSMLK